MTIYIAGPMTGIPGYNFAAFHDKETELIADGWKVLNPAKIGVLPDYGMYWPINRAMLDGADAIYLMEGWEGSVGARKEYYYATEKGIPMRFECPVLPRPLGEAEEEPPRKVSQPEGNGEEAVKRGDPERRVVMLEMQVVNLQKTVTRLIGFLRQYESQLEKLRLAGDAQTDDPEPGRIPLPLPYPNGAP